MTTKKCSGCKCDKQLDNDHFYKNKRMVDGYSNYCIECTRENSKNYFLRKKEKKSKIDNENLLKFTLLNQINGNSTDQNNTESLVKLLMIEKMGKSMLDEIESLKKSLIKVEF